MYCFQYFLSSTSSRLNFQFLCGSSIRARKRLRCSSFERWRKNLRMRVPLRCRWRSEEHTSELQSLTNLVCRLLLEKKKKNTKITRTAARRQECRSGSRRSTRAPNPTRTRHNTPHAHRTSHTTIRTPSPNRGHTHRP